MRDAWLRCSPRHVLLIGGVLVARVCAFSQANTGRILGTVTDQTGGAIAGATVSVTDTERGTTRTLTTDESGSYNASSLIPGTYTVSAQYKCFKSIERQNIVLEDWNFTERLAGEFRFEVFNLLNTTHYGNPQFNGAGGNTPFSTPTAFGAAAATPDVSNNNPALGSGGPREFQLGFRVSW